MAVVAAPGDITEPSGTAAPAAVPGEADAGTQEEEPVTAATPSPAPPSADVTGIPPVVLAAYRAAAGTLATTEPSCRLPWTLLAGIGKVESGHARGGRVGGTGTTEGPILGPRLDGGPGIAAIPDTDGGALDGDAVWDHAVGPMQLIPRTWRIHAADGNGDGITSPHNIYDAALAAGTYLCAGGGDLSRPAVQRAALMRYNPSTAYGTTVLAWAAAYLGGAQPSLPGSVPAAPALPRRVPAPAAPAPAPGVGAPVPAPVVAAPAPAPVVTAATPAVTPAPMEPVVTQPAPRQQTARSTPAPVRTATPSAPATAAAITTVAPPTSGDTRRTTAAPIVTEEVDGT